MNAYVVIAIIALAAVVYFAFRLMLSKVEDGAKAEEKQKQADVDKKRADEMMKDKTVAQVINDLINGRF